MLAELLEICLEPKRINELQSITDLFLDSDENECEYLGSFTIFKSSVLNLAGE